jgi:hypothetical protein
MATQNHLCAYSKLLKNEFYVFVIKVKKYNRQKLHLAKYAGATTTFDVETEYKNSIIPSRLLVALYDIKATIILIIIQLTSENKNDMAVLGFPPDTFTVFCACFCEILA